MPITKGDTVRVMRGDDKGKEGKVIRVFPKTGRVTIEGVNIVKKHRKARTRRGAERDHRDAGPDARSNVMLLDPKSGAPTRTRAGSTPTARRNGSASRAATRSRATAKSRGLT